MTGSDLDAVRAFVALRLNEDQQWALAANRPYRYADSGSAAPAGGVHWTWVIGDDWTPIDPDPVTEEYLGEHHPDYGQVSLGTIEEWPSTHTWSAGRHTSMMREVGIPSAEEVNPAWAGLIVRNGPAQVLARVEGVRALIAWLEALSELDVVHEVVWGGWLGVAAMWSDHPDYRPEWELA